MSSKDVNGTKSWNSREELTGMRYEIAKLFRSLEEYCSKTGSYFPVDTAPMQQAINKAKAALTTPEDLHEETMMEVLHAKTVIHLATALSDYDRDIAIALSALRIREQQEDDRDPQKPAFHINWLDERYKLLNFYGQLLDEEKDAMFQLALDRLRARGVLSPLPEGDGEIVTEGESSIPQKREPQGPMDMQAALVLSGANKAWATRDIRTIVIERHWAHASLTFSYFCWRVADGAILDSFPTSELSIVNRWLADHGLTSSAHVWEPL
jgi:hypothetical protein